MMLDLKVLMLDLKVLTLEFVGLEARQVSRRPSAVTPPARMYGIARGELCEGTSALEVALLTRGCLEEPARRGAVHADAAYALLSGLIRRAG